MLDDEKKQQQIDLLKRALDFVEQGKELPVDWAKIMFPSEKREYELSYYGKQTAESIISEVDPVPLQEVSRFNTPEGYDGWYNKLVFGDNLQVIKRLIDMKYAGELKNADGTDGVRLVYIDPPFSTRKDFKVSGEDQKAYQDKVAGSEFLEWLRRRLVLLRELLADDGSIFVHLDYRKGHYVKVLMDEIFGDGNFVNEIVYGYRIQGVGKKFYARKHDTIFWYSKNKDRHIFKPTKEKVIYQNPFIDTKVSRARVDELTDKDILLINDAIKFQKPLPDRLKGKLFNSYYSEVYVRDVWDSDDTKPLISGSSEYAKYPTQKSEGLLARIINNSSHVGDLILDCFAGSGTTAVVAEKLGRRWISCDVGKLSIYTQQKRLLNLTDKETKQPIKTTPFVLYNSGLYDFDKIRELDRNNWRLFALQLFNCEDTPHKVKGFEFDGYRSGHNVWVYDFHSNDGQVSKETVSDLHSRIGSGIDGDVYIIAPKGSFDFMEDYLELGGVRYYSLRIPYSFINELHKQKFTAINQPRNSGDVNEGVEAVGFDFIQTPDLEFEVKNNKIHISNFEGKTRNRGQDETHAWESFSMLMIDYDFDGNIFDLDETMYAKDFVDQSIDFDVTKVNGTAMLIFLDKFGNEARRTIHEQDLK